MGKVCHRLLRVASMCASSPITNEPSQTANSLSHEKAAGKCAGEYMRAWGPSATRVRLRGLELSEPAQAGFAAARGRLQALAGSTYAASCSKSAPSRLSLRQTRARRTMARSMQRAALLCLQSHWGADGLSLLGHAGRGRAGSAQHLPKPAWAVPGAGRHHPSSCTRWIGLPESAMLMVMTSVGLPPDSL